MTIFNSLPGSGRVTIYFCTIGTQAFPSRMRMNTLLNRILDSVKLTSSTEKISKVAWETGMHTGNAIGEKASALIDEAVDFIFGENE